MRKVINFISKRYKYVLTFILGLIVAGTSAYAITVASNTITYDNTNSGLASTNVQSAIDELYTKSNKLKATVGLYRNSNIVKVMKYDETANSSTLCITGNEATCEELAPTTTSTYNQGTIIDYKVNNSTTRRFHVIHDDGDKLTLQDQKNIIDNVAYVTKTDFIADGGTESEWNGCTYTSGGATYYGCSTRGPLTILPALESATDSWTNVNVQTYTAGTTSFGGNSNTGCTTTICNNNKYSMRERSARARLVTVPEAWAVGCGTGAQEICPKYMHNYLKNADEYEAIVDGGEISVVYWTMSAYSIDSGVAWDVAYFGNVNLAVLTVHGGGRAVVEINK